MYYSHYCCRQLTIFPPPPIYFHHQFRPRVRAATPRDNSQPCDPIGCTRLGAHVLAVVLFLAGCADAVTPHTCFLENSYFPVIKVRTAMPRDSRSPPAATYGGGGHGYASAVRLNLQLLHHNTAASAAKSDSAVSTTSSAVFMSAGDPRSLLLEAL